MIDYHHNAVVCMVLSEYWNRLKRRRPHLDTSDRMIVNTRFIRDDHVDADTVDWCGIAREPEELWPDCTSRTGWVRLG